MILTLLHKIGHISRNNGPIWKIQKLTGSRSIIFRPKVFLSVSDGRTGFIWNTVLSCLFDKKNLDLITWVLDHSKTKFWPDLFFRLRKERSCRRKWRKMKRRRKHKQRKKKENLNRRSVFYLKNIANRLILISDDIKSCNSKLITLYRFVSLELIEFIYFWPNQLNPSESVRKLLFIYTCYLVNQ